jgi:hypothetical protein
MPDDNLRNIEAMLGAIANITSGREEDGTLIGTRCPKCEWTGFAKVESVYDAAMSRINWDKSDPNAKYEGGLTDEQIARRLAPPVRRSPLNATIPLAIVLAVGAVYAWKRYGDVVGEAAAIAAVVITVMFLLTRARKLSDGYYAGRARWRKLYMCRKCGQLIDPTAG